MLRGGIDARRRAELIERFDLDPHKKARTYSKGNRQKVSLVSAFASNAELLLLDEPSTGLDPLMENVFQQCVVEARDRGVTVLLSSHLLHEVQIIADELVMIGRGKIVAQGRKEDLLGAQGTRVGSLDNERLADAVRRAGLELTGDRTGLLVKAAPEAVGRIALDAGIVLTELHTTGSEGLEQLFLSLTAADARDAAAA